MKEPFFTVVIPTKDRPDRLANAVRSVLEQTFADFELVVCDNSDESMSDETKAVVDSAADERARYIRTSGRLSMPDNWEHAVAQAQGAYVGVLTDRSVYHRHALGTAHREIEATGAKCVSWFSDQYGRAEPSTGFKRRATTFKRHRLDSKLVLDYFVHGHPKYSSKIVPKLMTAVCARSVLDAIRASPVGRCCPPVCPDFTSGFLMLAHCEWVLTLDEALYVSCGTGTGSAFRRRTDLGDQFRSDLGMTWDEMVDRMPSPACFSHALTLNDLMRLRDADPERFPGIEVDRPQYYLGCMTDFAKTAQTNRAEDLDLLLESLEQEPKAVQHKVKSTRLYASIFTTAARQVVEVTDAPGTRDFESVFDALDWDRANPRTPAETSFLDELPSLDDLKRVRPLDRRAIAARKSARAAARGLGRAHLTPRELVAARLAEGWLQGRAAVNYVRSRVRLRTRLRTLVRRV